MVKTFSRAWRFFQSRNLALVLLAIVTGGILVASLIPQQGHVSTQNHTGSLLSTVVRTLLLDHIYSAWWFFLAFALLLVNTFVCTISRIPSLVRRGSRLVPFKQEQAAQMPNTATLSSPRTAGESASSIEKVFERRRFVTVCADQDSGRVLSARKGELANWGSLFFHFSFLVILVGVIWVQMSRQVGTMIIAESQTVTERSEDYLREGAIPLLGMKHLGFQIRLDTFSPTYLGNTGTDYAADLVIIDGGKEVKRQTVRVNQPLTYRGISFILGVYGFAPLFELKDSSGSLLFDGYVNLRVLNPESVDSFELPDSKLVFRARFYPDLLIEQGRMTSRSLSPDNPALYVEAYDAGNQVFSGLLPIGGTIAAGNQTLAFTGLNYWSQFQVVRDPGKEVIFAGFWLGLAGLCLRYLLTPKHVIAFVVSNPEGSSIIIGGTAPHLDSLFAEEFASLVKEVKEDISDDSA